MRRFFFYPITCRIIHMETWQLVLIIVISALIFGIVGFTIFAFAISSMMANKMCHPKHFKSNEEKIKENNAIKDLDGANGYQRIPITFKMSDGYIIHGDYSLNNPKKFVICLHGHISNRQGLVKYAYSFYRLGYSLVFIDHRSHGENERGIVTMGYQEHKDVLEVITLLKQKFGDDIEIGLFGCSMGGATALLCVEERQDLSFVVSDCAFASLEDLVRDFIKAHLAPYWPILQITEMFLKKRYGLSYKDASPKESLKNNMRVPILFIHGMKDDFVYSNNAKYLYNNDNGPKRLALFENAGHCGSIISNKERYYKVIEDFINEETK